MLSSLERRLIDFKGPPNVLSSPKKRMYPERNLHYVSHNSVLLPTISDKHSHSVIDHDRTQRLTDRVNNQLLYN